MALLAATIDFLLGNDISQKLIVESIRQHHPRRKLNSNVRQYRRMVRAYEDMGIVMSTWFSLPKFLDADSRPLPLTRFEAKILSKSHPIIAREDFRRPRR